MEYNQLALQLFQMGFFRADMAEQALRCLDLMEFKNKDQLAAVIRQGQQRSRQVEWLQQQLMQAARLLDAGQGTRLAEALAQEMAADTGGVGLDISALRTPGGGGGGQSAVQRQRQRSQEAVRPR